MKAVLSIPHHWQQDPRYAKLCDGTFLREIGRQILRVIKQNRTIFQTVPPEIPVEVDWVQDNGNPAICEPLLVIEAAGASHMRQIESVNQVTYRIASALVQSHLHSVIPDCQIRLRLVSEYTIPLGG